MGQNSERLLIVDDHAGIRSSLSHFFSEGGWEVDSAGGKEAAEALLAQTEYTVVIADMRLTGINGVEGLDIIQRSRRLWPRTRVVLLTGDGTPELEAEARRRGADAFLHKPLPLRELGQVVTRLKAMDGSTPRALPTASAWSPHERPRST